MLNGANWMVIGDMIAGDGRNAHITGGRRACNPFIRASKYPPRMPLDAWIWDLGWRESQFVYAERRR